MLSNLVTLFRCKIRRWHILRFRIININYFLFDFFIVMLWVRVINVLESIVNVVVVGIGIVSRFWKVLRILGHHFAFIVFVAPFLIFPNRVIRTNTKLFHITPSIGVVIFNQIAPRIFLWLFSSIFQLSPPIRKPITDLFLKKTYANISSLKGKIFFKSSPEYTWGQFFVLTISFLLDLDMDFPVVVPTILLAFVWFPV